MKRAFFLLLGIGTIATAANCGGTASLEGRSCPCTDGFVCCEATSICLAPGATCGTSPVLPDAASDKPDAAPDGPVVDLKCGAEPHEPPPVDAGGAGDPDGGAVCPTTAPITAASIDAQLPWKPAAAAQNVCTQQNIDALKALFKSAPAGVKFADMKTSLGAACASCAFSPIGAPNWQVFVEDGSGAIDNRTGSCFAARVGGACGPRYGAVCGKARFRFETCMDIACTTNDCGSEQARQACLNKAQKGACKAVSGAYALACPNEADLLAVCGNIFQAIATSCSGGPNHTIDTTTP